MSGYIMDLRKYVGHMPLIQCASSIIVENEVGQVLLGKRTDNHMWGYSGGSMEIDETAENCAKRELLEEMGLVAEQLDFFMINSGPETHYIYPNGDEVSNVEIVYICRKYRGELKAQEEEMSELRFFNISDIPDDISTPVRPVMKRYIESRRKKISATESIDHFYHKGEMLL